MHADGKLALVAGGRGRFDAHVKLDHRAMGVHLDLFQRVNVSPASVSAISYSEPAPSVMLVNWTVPESGPDKEPSPGPGTRRSN